MMKQSLCCVVLASIVWVGVVFAAAPAQYVITINNQYYYDATNLGYPDGYIPNDPNDYPNGLPPGKISASSQSQFTFAIPTDLMAVAGAPGAGLDVTSPNSVSYRLDDDVDNTVCTFSYSYDGTNCWAQAATSSSRYACFVSAGNGQPPASNQCAITFCIGSMSQGVCGG